MPVARDLQVDVVSYAEARSFPLVEALSDGRERTMRELTDLLAERFKLTEQERQEVLPSGQQSIFSNRVAWAKSYLKAASPASGSNVRSAGVTTT
jgi:restriction endonuclease Mrr